MYIYKKKEVYKLCQDIEMAGHVLVVAVAVPLENFVLIMSHVVGRACKIAVGLLVIKG